MKLKNLTSAIAMASLGVASFAAQAETATSFYGSVRVGVEYQDTGDEDTTKLRNYNSRMGFKGETDIGGNMQGFGHYEFGVGTDASDESTFSTRKAYVGLKGDFGRVRIGQDYHTFYNTIIAPTDIGWSQTMSGSSALGTYTGRTGEALTFDSKFGPVAISTTSYMGDDKLGDGYEFGASLNVGPVKFGAAVQDAKDLSKNATTGATVSTDRKVYGVSAGGKVGKAEYGVSYTDFDEKGTSIDVHLGLGPVYVTGGQADLDAGTKPVGYAVGYTHKIGKNTSAWVEAAQTDDDKGASTSETTAIRAALKYDF